MQDWLLKDAGDYKLMNQTGVKQFVFPDNSDHNAIWDTAVMPDGAPYFSLATELSTAGYSRLCRYNYAQNTVDELFRVEDVIMPSDRAIRASKFHTSICMMNDGRMVMTTHTTDKSPNHPSWMPINYYHHLWEGYAGSNIVVYDPKTGKAENLGIPVPHETIYGSLYDPRHNALFFTGGFRGHAYRYSFDDHSLKDFGQVSENWDFRLKFDGMGNIISASRSGWFYLINTDTLEITDLNFRHPFVTYPEYGADYKGFSNGAMGPDGRLYIAYWYGRTFGAYDPKTRTFEDMGDYLPTKGHALGETRHGVYGMEFDRQGVLWYAVFSRNCDSSRHEIGLPSSLFRWDIARGGKPEWMGVIGTKKRAACWTSELAVNDDDILFIVGSNHATDGPDITAVDLKVYREHMYDFGAEVTEDEYYVNRENRHYLEVGQFFYDNTEFLEENNWKVPYDLAAPPARLWRALAPAHIEDSPVAWLAWQDNDTLCGVCGAGGQDKYVFTLKSGKLEGVVPVTEAKALYEKLLAHKPVAAPAKGLPFYPGRQYKAVASASAALGSGRTAVGTEDGMLAVVDGEKVFRLGPAAYNGPIRAMSALPGGSAVFGVGGDVDDIGIVFRYDDENGLQWLGHVNWDPPSPEASISCPLLSACAVSPDGKTLAIGSADRLGTVVLYKLP